MTIKTGLEKQKHKKKVDYKKKAWKVFGDWIKKRDNYTCVTCGSRNGNQSGHFWHACLDFDEMNINAQCKHCNHFWSGNLAPYSIYLIRKYGQEAFEDLEQRHWIAMRGEYRTEADYLAIIKKYDVSQ